MKYLRKILFWLTLTILVVTLHFFIASTLPFPFDKINVLFIYLIVYLLYRESGAVVWLGFFTHLFIEIFPSNIFGLTLLSSSLSLLFAYWFHRYYITNRKWYGASVLIFVTLLFYRLLYALFLFFLNRFQTGEEVLWLPFLQLGFWELILTTLCFIVTYFLLLKFSKPFSREMKRQL